MAKQLSLFVRDKQAVKILTAICAEKRLQAAGGSGKNGRAEQLKRPG